MTGSHTTTTQAVEASGPGALPGFETTCGDCRFVARNAFRFNAEQDGRSHAAFMAYIEPKARRSARSAR